MRRYIAALGAAIIIAGAWTYAQADLTYTQGAGTTLFDFVCFSTKHCPVHVPINSAGTEIFTAAAPGQVDGTNGAFPVAKWGGGTLGAMANYGTSPGAVLVPGVNAFITNTPAVTVSGVSTAANQTSQITQETATAAVLGTTADSVCGTATGTCTVAALIKFLNQTALAGTASFGSAQPASGIAVGGLAKSSEPAAATTGNLTAPLFDLAGKQVTSPYANRENFLNCAITITNTSATTCTGMGAQGASVKIYITDITCTRNDAGTTAVSATLNDTATTIVDLPNNGGGGGYSHTYNVPLQVAANTAFQVTMSGSITSIHCSASGFKGY